MTALYPEIDPTAHGMLAVGDGQTLYWETCGNAAGKPALVLHGGPGSGASATARRYLDPGRHRIVLFDQRGCGRSMPHASGTDIDLATVSTAHHLADIERLRRHLGVERWLLLGGSWGSTLALAYAERHPDRVSGLLLYSVTTTTAAEIDWITRGVGAFFPEAWERFRDAVTPADHDGDLATAYHRLLMDPDPEVHGRAAAEWCRWEEAILATAQGHRPHPRWHDPRFRLAFARLVTHCWANRAFLAPDELVANAGRLAGIAGVLIHGRLDLGSPLLTPWRLSRAWPGSTLVVVATAGHDSRDPGMHGAIVAAGRRLAGAG